jgi:carbamoyl-phosphate synthase large subunit
VRPVYKRVDTCAAEFATQTAYIYSCYETIDGECEAEPTTRKKIMVLGGGPNRIGQGIEFDYCCVHAALAMREDGYETIMVNCNPETVSTDYDTSDRLYFEPVTLEDVLEIVAKEQPLGVIVQYGGQTPLKLALDLEANGVPIIGTSPDSIDIAEDRERFQKLLHTLGLKQPPNRTARTEEAALQLARRSATRWWCAPATCWAAGRWRSCTATRTCSATCARRCACPRSRPVLLDRFLDDAIEVDVDCISDGTAVMIGGIMEHIEQAGVHSGDSACSLPPYTLPKKLQDELRRQTTVMALALKVVGLMNVQFAIQGDRRRRRRRHGLRAGSEPARLAHRALCQQGHRPAAGQDRGTLHGRPEAGRPDQPRRPAAARGDSAVLQRQGSGVPVQQVPGWTRSLAPRCGRPAR